MSDSVMFHDGNRRLQDEFDSRRIADRLEEKLTRTAFTEVDRAFIEGLPFFFLATADDRGRADCSFKGGMPGFVRVVGASELAFPDYDGNGMFKSLGNVLVNPEVGLLFIEWAPSRRRLRVNGTATVSRDDPLMQRFAGAQLPGARGGAGDLPQLPALYHDAGMRRAVQVCATSGPCPAGAGLEGLRRLQGLHSSSTTDADRRVGATRTVLVATLLRGSRC